MPKQQRRKLIITLASAATAAVIFLSCLIIFLPEIVSSEWVRKLLEKHASGALNRPVNIEQLEWKWSDKILLTGISVNDDPIFSDKPMISVKKAIIKINFPTHPRSSAWKLKNHYLVFDFIASNIDARLIRNKHGQTNLEKLLSGSGSSEKDKKEKPESQKEIRVPVDIKSRIYLNNIRFQSEDHAQETQLICNGASVHLDIPSLKYDPMTLNVSSEMELNNRKISPLHLKLIIENMFNSKGTLVLKDTNINMDGVLSGVNVKIDTDLIRKELKTRLKIDLPEFMNVLKPFAPVSISSAKATGNLEFEAEASENPSESYNFDARLKGTDLGLSGGFLKEKSLNRVNAEISAKGVFNKKNRSLSIQAAKLDLLEKSHFLLSGVIKGLNKETPELDIKIESILLDIGEIFDRARTFIPGDFPLSFNESDSSPVLEIQDAGFSGNVPLETNQLYLNHLVLNMPAFQISNLQESTVSAVNLNLSVDKMNLSFKKSFLEQLDVKAGLSINNMEVKGRLVSPAEIAGDLEFEAEVSGSPTQTLSFDASLKGSDLNLSGINSKTLEHVDIKTANKGFFDKANGILSIDAGTLDILQKSHVLWTGKIKGLNSGIPESDIKVKSLFLDIGEVFNKVKAFVPKDFPLNFKQSPVLEIKDADFSGPLPSGPNNLRLKEFILSIPDIDLSKSDAFSVLSAANFKFAITDSNLSIKESIPTQLNLTTSFSIDKLKMKKPGFEFQISDLQVPGLTVKADNIRKSEHSLFGVALQADIKESLAIKELNIPSVITAYGIGQSLAVNCNLPPKSDAGFVIRIFNASVPNLVVKNKKYGTVRTGSELNLKIAGIKLKNTTPLNADIKGAKLRLDIGEMLSMNIEADAKDTGSALLDTKGNLTVDLSDLSRLSRSFFSKNKAISVKSGGKAELGWDISGRIPNNSEIEKLEHFSASTLEKDLDFLNRLDIFFKIKDADAALTLKNGQRLTVRNVSFPQVLRYTFDRKTGNGKLTGKIYAGSIDEIPFIGQFEKPLSISLSVSGEHNDYLKSVKFSQSVEVKPFNIKENVQVSFQRIDWISDQISGQTSDRRMKTPLSLWLRHVSGNIHTGLSITQGADLAVITDKFPFLPKTEFVADKWNLDTGFEAGLVAGQNIRTKAWAHLPEINIRSDKLFSINGLKASLSLEKKYQITAGKKKNTKKITEQPLSHKVVQTDSAEKFMPNLKKFSPASVPLNPLHTVSFKSANIEAGSLPLKFEHSMLDFNLDNSLPGLNYFRINLAGGTLTGSLSLSQRNTDFFLVSQIAFSGLNTGKILPDMAKKMYGQESEISGRLSVMLPFYTELKPILREMQMEIIFTHIGSQAIERLLYALDPFESNEAIISQRRVFQTGTPRWIRAVIKNGSLSLTGEAEIKGVRIEIPRLNHLNISNLSWPDQVEKNLAGLKPLIRILEISSADILEIDNKGEISFVKQNNVK
ncbi:MAG: hypothetical protein GY749_36605 [Desulfobacteraceae bacterium]|nr:hypothetical protein [Desulfobacteraceae bacterium]